MNDELNRYHISNPDGVDKTNNGEKKTSFSNDSPRFVKEDALNNQRESFVDRDANERSRWHKEDSVEKQEPSVGSSSSAGRSASSAATATGASVTSAMGGGITAFVGAVAATVATAVIVVVTFLTVIGVNLSLIMADMNSLTFQLEVVTEGEGELENPYYLATISGNGIEKDLTVMAGDYFTFDGLEPNKEYLVTIRDSEGEVQVQNTYCTTAEEVRRGWIEAFAEEGEAFVYVGEVFLSKGEFYTVTAKNERGDKLFVADDVEPQKEFRFSLKAPTRVLVTLSVGGKVLAFAETEWIEQRQEPVDPDPVDPTPVDPEPQYDLDNYEWDWDGEVALLYLQEKNGGEPLVIKGTVTMQEMVAPTCDVWGEGLFTATAYYEGREYKGERVESLPPTGHAYGAPEFEWIETDNGYTATATFVCKKDPEHLQKITAEKITTEVYASDCETDGSILYRAIVTFDGVDYSDELAILLPATGHAYGEPEFVWNEKDDGYTATAIFTCLNDPTHTESVLAEVSSEGGDPTCEEDGEITYYAWAVFEDKEYEDQKTVTLPATGHSYGEPAFAWTEISDGYSATATFTCLNDPEHNENLAATVTIKERVEAGCENDGFVTYLATVTLNDVDYTEEKTDVLPATGHSYGAPEFVWNEMGDGYTATAVFTCLNGPTHTESVLAEVASEGMDATCEEDGEITYYASVTFEDKEYEDQKTVILPATGHSYGEPAFAWTEISDGYSATATFTCLNDPEHNENLSATVTIKERVEAGCEVDGYVTYLATVTLDDVEYTDEKTDELSATGHSYGAPEFVWNEMGDGYTAMAVFTCLNDPTHTESVLAEVSSEGGDPTCEEDGEITYYASVTFEDKEYEDQKTVTLPATGHSYGEPAFAWTEISDGYSATATFTCLNDPEHNENLSATVTIKERVEAGCENDGFVTYLATVTLDDVEYTDEKTDELPATGHSYGAPEFVWNETGDGYTATAVFTCLNDLTHTESVLAEVSSEGGDPTCEEDGEITYYAWAVFENEEYEDQKTVTLPATGHSYGAPAFAWTEISDGYSAIATFTCLNDPEHTENLSATVTIKERVEADCENDGFVTYLATVTLDGVDYTDEKTDELSATGHAYGAPEFVWNETGDGYTATAVFTCLNDPTHTESVLAEVSSEGGDPTCEEDGEITYYAFVTFNDEEYEGQKTVTLPATGHSYGEPAFAWTEISDGYSTTATFTCLNDPEHTENLAATVTIKERVEAGCENDGFVTYLATVTLDGVDYTEEKTDVLSATGHSYGAPEFVWSETGDGYTATAVFTCLNDPTHTESVLAEVTSEGMDATCEEDGEITYYASVIFENEEYEGGKTVIMSATGHNYGDLIPQVNPDCENDGMAAHYYCPACETYFDEDKNAIDEEELILPATGHDYEAYFSWEDSPQANEPSVSLTLVCKNDAEHQVKDGFEIALTYEDMDPACEEDGYRLYTATAVYEEKEYKDTFKQVYDGTATGHNLIDAPEPTFDWTGTVEEGYTATATFVCPLCGEEVVMDAEVYADLSDLCLEAGTARYTATVTINNSRYVDEKQVESEALGHDYVVSFDFEAYPTANAVDVYYYCRRNPEHYAVVSDGVEVTEEDDVYIVTVVFEEVTHRYACDKENYEFLREIE